jgi:hypothetical protein
MHGVHVSAGPGSGQQAHYGDFGNVAGGDPGHRLVDGQDAGAHGVELKKQIGSAGAPDDRGATRAATAAGGGDRLRPRRSHRSTTWSAA